MADDTHLVLEHIEGPTLRLAAETLKDREQFFARLLATIQAMHAAGVAHGDLKRKENTLVGPGELPYLIDFGVACIEQADAGRYQREKFALMRQMDLNAWIKLKYGSRPENMTADDAVRYRPLLIERWARSLRGPWKVISMRSARKRRQSPD
jgi:serine/threonine protein kinase